MTSRGRGVEHNNKSVSTNHMNPEGEVGMEEGGGLRIIHHRLIIQHQMYAQFSVTGGGRSKHC